MVFQVLFDTLSGKQFSRTQISTRVVFWNHSWMVKWRHKHITIGCAGDLTNVIGGILYRRVVCQESQHSTGCHNSSNLQVRCQITLAISYRLLDGIVVILPSVSDHTYSNSIRDNSWVTCDILYDGRHTWVPTFTFLRDHLSVVTHSILHYRRSSEIDANVGIEF